MTITWLHANIRQMWGLNSAFSIFVLLVWFYLIMFRLLSFNQYWTNLHTYMLACPSCDALNVTKCLYNSFSISYFEVGIAITHRGVTDHVILTPVSCNRYLDDIETVFRRIWLAVDPDVLGLAVIEGAELATPGILAVVQNREADDDDVEVNICCE